MLFAGVTWFELALVAGMTIFASIVGGLTGYGTGLLLPLVLVPIIGAEAVVPVITVSAILTNFGRVTAFRSYFEKRCALLVFLAALPTCLIGAWGYTRLGGRGASLLIGTVLILLVPVRRLLKRLEIKLSQSGVAAASVGYGLIVGGASGTGVVLLSILMAAGLEAKAVIATDAGISMGLGLAKIVMFQNFGALPASSWMMALLIGVIALPGGYIARWMADRMTQRLHNGLLDAAVILGGVVMIYAALKGAA